MYPEKHLEIIKIIMKNRPVSPCHCHDIKKITCAISFSQYPVSHVTIFKEATTSFPGLRTSQGKGPGNKVAVAR